MFPPRVPTATVRIDVGDGHNLYVEEIGNPQGIPVVFLHGGPGAGVTPIHRQLFDPDIFRVILFDQRGAGQSRPFGATNNNTTAHLVADMEIIRAYFGIDKWIVYGGSWGATLGLVYGITHPTSCFGFVLRGVFLGTKAEVDWFLYGMGRFYPEAWDRFVSGLPKAEQGDILRGYYNRLSSDNPMVATAAAEHWSAYENSCATLRAELRDGGGTAGLSLATLEVHYFRHDCFLEDDYIINNIGKIIHLPSLVVQGRHDVICPPISAMKLVKKWPNADLKMVDNAGHSVLETGVLQALLSGMGRMAGRIQ